MSEHHITRLTCAVFFVLVLVLPVATAPATAASKWSTSKSAIESLGERFVRATNTADTVKARAVLDSIVAHDPPAPDLSRWMGQVRRLHQSLGALKFHHAEVTSARRDNPDQVAMHVFVATPAGLWKDLQFFVSTAPPARIQQLVFIADVAEPVYLPNGDITDLTSLDWLRGYDEKLATSNDLSGGILIAIGDSVLFEDYFGFEDIAKKRPVTPETRFNLGSGNKMFTAIEIARLVGAKKMTFDDPVAKFTLALPESVVDPHCTVRQLLSHTSGVREYWTEQFDKEKPVLTEMSQFVPWIARAGRAGEPGKRFEYCNSNFILAGLVIEKVSGDNYFEVVRENLYRPLGMSNSSSRRETDDAVGFASPLKRVKGGGWEIASSGPGGSSAGGGVSTPRDLLHFARAFAKGQVVPKEMVAELTRSQVAGLKAEIDYGLGFERWSEGQVASYGHGGIAAGVNFELRIFPDRDITFILFSNQDNGAYDDLRKNAIKLITGWR